MSALLDDFTEEIVPKCPKLTTFVWRGQGQDGVEIRWEREGEFWCVTTASASSFDAEGAEFRAVFDSFV